MNTTLLFAELLIIGLQSAVWIFILLINVFSIGWVQTLQTSNLTNWQTAILIVLLSIFYVIGVIIDRAADALFSKWEKKLSRIVRRCERARHSELSAAPY